MAPTVQDPTIASFTPPNIFAMIRALVNNNVPILSNPGAPSSGTTGTFVGIAGPGCPLIDYTNGNLYINSGTIGSPTWSIVAKGSFAPVDAIIGAGTNTSGTTTGVSISVTGALTTDIPIVTWRVAPQTIAHIIAVATTAAITVTLSTTVGTAGTLNYAVVRPL